MDDVILEYLRDGSDLSTGSLHYYEKATNARMEISKFESLTYPAMMARFAEALCDHPECGGVIQRCDRPGLKPFRLDTPTVEKLRTDPVSVIRSMSFEPQTIVVRKKDQHTSELSPLRIGYDAIAATFGHEVYCRMRGDLLECPACGRWGVFRGGVVRCRSMACQLSITVVLRGDRWGSVGVQDLLASHADRFYLPREWNKTAPWITKEELKNLHDKWIEFKEKIV